MCIILAKGASFCMNFVEKMPETAPKQFREISREISHGSVSARRAGRHHQHRQSDGHRRVRVRRICPSRSAGAARAVQIDGLCGGGAAPQQADHALSPRRYQLPRQRGARQPRRRFRRGSRSLRAVDGVSGGRCQKGLRARAVAWRGSRRGVVGAEDARCPRHQGHRRQSLVLRRSLRHQGLGLRLPSSNGSLRAIRGRRGRGSIISITSPTMCIAAA